MISCDSNNFENKIANDWQVIKLQKYIKVTSNGYTPITIDINPKTSYNFKKDGETEIITQLGTKMNGTWKIKDSTIIVIVKGEEKNFRVDSITDNTMLLYADKFKFHLKKK